MSGKKIIDGMKDAVAYSKGEKPARVTLKQDRGETIVFTGTLLAQTDFETRAGHIFYDVWETEGGAYIASSVFEHADTGNEERRACVVEPQDDKATMRREIMDFLDWNARARSMMRKQAGWSFTREVA